MSPEKRKGNQNANDHYLAAKCYSQKMQQILWSTIYCMP